MRRRDRTADAPNFWPSYTDVSLITILILIVFLFSQLVSNADGLRLLQIRIKQDRMQALVEKRVGREALRDIRFSSAFSSQQITFSDTILFAKGQAELQPRGQAILGSIADVLLENTSLYRAIQIEGHTDKDPIREGGSFRSNWDLSSARATAVVKFFADKGLDPWHVPISAAGFAEFRPVDTGEGEGSKSRNRRIELIVHYTADDAQ